MQFAYRYVKYGPSFSADPALRAPGPVAAGTEERLAANELAVDVGSCCFGWEGCDLPVFDHHFARAGQWPSAAATVLANATALQTIVAERMRNAGAGPDATIWLVSHREPDLDAFVSMYLARALLERRIPAAEVERFARCATWQAPEISGVSDEVRWPILLAAAASVVDQGWRLRVPREMALHAVLYAAQVRDRTLAPTGAVAVLDAARDAMCAPEYRNPLTDCLFQHYGAFARELDLLKGEDARFRRDLARARRSVVMPHKERFEDWFPAASRTPFYASPGVVHAAHTRAATPDRALAPGVWIRDPESILFKEWARAEGFLFTAIAHSKSREYYFSLDPEKAGDLHLYDLWARLQQREMRARGTEQNQLVTPRSDFIGRQVGNDPWYDGSAYRGTIVVTPHAGSLLPAGSAADLSDDAVATVVREGLEDSVFASRVTWRDMPLADNGPSTTGEAALDELPGPPVHAAFRRAHVKLSDAVAFRNPEICSQVADRLWPMVAPPGSATPPPEHVVLESGALVVWSRQGAVIAHHGSTEAVIVRGLLDALDEFVSIRREAHALATRSSTQPSHRLAAGRRLLERVARLKLTADGPNGLSLGRLMEDSSFEDVLSSLRTAAEFDQAEQTRRADDGLQVVLGIGLTIGLVWGFFQVWSSVSQRVGSDVLAGIFGFGFSLLPACLVLHNRRKK
jgi:hypothetical protein